MRGRPSARERTTRASSLSESFLAPSNGSPKLRSKLLQIEDSPQRNLSETGAKVIVQHLMKTQSSLVNPGPSFTMGSP